MIVIERQGEAPAEQLAADEAFSLLGVVANDDQLAMSWRLH